MEEAYHFFLQKLKNNLHRALDLYKVYRLVDLSPKNRHPYFYFYVHD